MHRIPGTGPPRTSAGSPGGKPLWTGGRRPHRTRRHGAGLVLILAGLLLIYLSLA